MRLSPLCAPWPDSITAEPAPVARPPALQTNEQLSALVLQHAAELVAVRAAQTALADQLADQEGEVLS